MPTKSVKEPHIGKQQTMLVHFFIGYDFLADCFVILSLLQLAAILSATPTFVIQ